MDGADSPLTTAADLLRQAEQSADPRYAGQVIGLLEGGKAADRYPDAGATYWTVLGMAYYLLFERTGDGTALQESVSAFRTVADGIARADPRWPSCASNLANTLVDVFAVTGSAAALTEAVGVLLAQAIDARAPRDIVHDAAPDLADRLTRIDTAHDRTDVSLPMAKESVPADTSASRAVAESRMALASERDAVVAEITAAGMGGLVAWPIRGLRRPPATARWW